MKKVTLLAIGLLLVAQTSNLSAGNIIDLDLQSKNKTSDDDGIKGKIMFHGGAGLNLLFTSLRLKYELSSYWQDHELNADNCTASPIYNFGIDYGFAKQFSAGASFGYQTARFSSTAGDNGLTFVDSWKRIHFAVRADYHIIAKEHISLYTGLKIGYNVYSMTSTRTAVAPGYVSELNVNPSPYTVQAHIGFSYYFNSIVGINTELGIGVGGPYIFAAGVAVKI